VSTKIEAPSDVKPSTKALSLSKPKPTNVYSVLEFDDETNQSPRSSGNVKTKVSKTETAVNGGNELQPSSSNIWKHAYMLEVNNVAQEPSCFFSKLSRLDGALLGVPLVYTTNPVTQNLDYVSSAFDILSWSSFQMDGCKRSAWGDKCTAFLPLYLDKQHYQQGIPILKTMAKKLTNFTEGDRMKENNNPKRRHATMKVSTVSEPEVLRCEEDCVIKLLVSMMNTQVVLLSDKGISASEDSLNGYCQLHL